MKEGDERKSRLSKRKQTGLLEYFVAGTTARTANELIGVQANTATGFHMRLGRLIAQQLPTYMLAGEIEAEESCFGGTRKGKRGRGAAGKVAVLGLLKQGGKVHTAILANAKSATLPPPLHKKIRLDSIVHTDAFHA